jgi:hypothetical protein
MKRFTRWLRQFLCDHPVHSEAWEHGHGWSRKRCLDCGFEEWFA